MTKRTPTRARVRTAAALKADAPLLAGTRPRLAHADTSADTRADTSAPAGGEQTTAELWLYGVVGGWWYGFDAESVASALRSIDADVIYVRIHSPGGLASDGVAIGNLFRNHTAKIVVVVDGLAASAASVIAIAGDEIVMCPGSQMMLHDASTFEYGNAGDHRKIADWLDGQSQNYAGVYATRAGGTAEQWREVMLADDGWGTWYTAEEAVSAGLADSVGTRPAAGSPPTTPAPAEFDEGDDELLARVEHDLRLLEHDVHPSARAAWQGRGTPKPPSASAVGSYNTHHTEGGTPVSFNDNQESKIRVLLGLPEDADEATVNAAITAAEEKLTAPPEKPSAALTVPDGHVVIPAVQLQELKDGAAMGVKAAQTLHERDREAFLDANKAKYAAGNRGAWAKEYDRDPEGTRKHFAEAPDLIPTELLGHEHDGVDREDGAQAKVSDQPGYKNWSM